MASRWILHVTESAGTVESLRATVGFISVTPNVRNVIPDKAVLTLDVRHPEDTLRERVTTEFLEKAREIAADHGGVFEVKSTSTQSTVPADVRLSAILGESLRDCGVRPYYLPSGAGHDAAVMAERYPMALLFLRHPGGISHHPDERVLVEDVELAIRAHDALLNRLANNGISQTTNKG